MTMDAWMLETCSRVTVFLFRRRSTSIRAQSQDSRRGLQPTTVTCPVALNACIYICSLYDSNGLSFAFHLFSLLDIYSSVLANRLSHARHGRVPLEFLLIVCELIYKSAVGT